MTLPAEATSSAPGRGRLTGRQVLMAGVGTRSSPEMAMQSSRKAAALLVSFSYWMTAMPHRLDGASAFGELTSIACSRAGSAHQTGACTGRPEHLPNGGHVHNVMGAWPPEPMTQPQRGHFWCGSI